MTEFELIERLIPNLPGNDTVLRGAGDDCAVLDVGIPGAALLFKTDAVVEGVHFTPETPREKVGRKALARCMSDIAAMAGQPSSAVVTIGLPKDFDPVAIEQIYTGLNDLARYYEIAVVGGETTLSQQLWVSVALIGLVEKGKVILRSGAKAGDAIFVTGELGGSLAGRHLDFEPRVQEASWLAASFDIHAMIDLSDGLAGDIRHILKASGVGANLLADAIPISTVARLKQRSDSSAKPPLLAALTDGEDFELLFTLPSKQAVPLVDAWKQVFPALKLSCIGKVMEEPGLRLRDKQGNKPLEAHGYAHFS